MVTAIFILVLLLCLVFMYTDGFQDGSSVTASAIGCRALSAIQAVVIASSCEFAGALFGGSAVAGTVIGITSWPARSDLLPVLACGLLTSIIWNSLTRRLKLPSSSTHALFGGLIGAVIAGSGASSYLNWGRPDRIIFSTGVWRVGLSLFISPCLGVLFGFLMLVFAYALLRRATTRVNRPIKALQAFTVAGLAFSHGANDSQKVMGVTILALNAAGMSNSDTIPLWVRIATGAAIALGVASLAPGIVKRVGTEIYRLRPIHGLTAQLASAAIILAASASGGPVSTTQVISSSIMGVGGADRLKGVHWLVARDILLAWFLTIPVTAAIAAASYEILFRWLIPAG